MSAAAAGSGVTRAPSRNATKCTQVAWPGLASRERAFPPPGRQSPCPRVAPGVCACAGIAFFFLLLDVESPCRCRAPRVCAPGLGDARPRARTAACVRGAESGAGRANPRTGGTRASPRLFKCCVCCAARLRLRFRSRTELGMGAEKGCRSLRWWSWPATGWAKAERAKAAGPPPSPWSSAWSGDGDTSTPHLTSPCARRRARMHACEPCHPCLPRAAQRVPSAPAALRTGTYSYAVV